ncbi:MAG: LytR C-terminal domain-containing protein [Candidatus Levybacteria bacterium]|nr:LytR C-terminal domain-containing protein [Candidatus Levybacteria bacterium]MDZ4228328.1 LytR C-terminal domain-containing protein [Candidatus Levybacteria bacterium]
MKKQKESALSNTKIAIVFFILLVFIVGISLTVKVITVLKNGQFDSSKRFTLTIANGKNIEVMSLSPDLKEIVVFKLNDNVNLVEAGRFLEIPIDGFIVQNSLDLNQKVDSLFVKTILNYNKLKTNLTIIDLLKLTMLARAIPESSVNVKMVGDANGLELDKVVGRLANDTSIEKDHQTIRIINGTEVIGLGNRLARLITNMGGNVIIVVTSDSLMKKSVILHIDEKTYTVKRLQKVLGYEVAREENNAISDITIVIGEDKVKNLAF